MQEYIVSHALSLQFSFYRISKRQQAPPVIKKRKRKSQKRKVKKTIRIVIPVVFTLNYNGVNLLSNTTIW